MPQDEPNLTPAELADMSALADGSIDPRRRQDVEAWIAVSGERREIYRSQRMTVERLRQARMTDRAPAGLRHRVEQQRLAATPAGRRRGARLSPRFGFSMAVVGTLAAAIAVVTLALPTGTPGSPSVAQAASLALAGATQPGPGADPRDPRARLAQTVQDIYFPNWQSTLGWRAVGERRDKLGGRRAITVYYASHGKHVAYTILAAPVLSQPSAPSTMLNGFDLRTFSLNGRTVVTWRRAGHTCVISADGVPAATLHQLASWRRGAISR